jgi:purine nucleosidase
VTRNALSVATVIGMNGVPIAAGCTRPLVRTVEVAESIHGDSGMEGPRLREPTTELDPRQAVDLIVETVATARRFAVHVGFAATRSGAQASYPTLES